MSPTPQQVNFFREQGYLVLRADEHKLVTPEELKIWTEEIAAWPRAPGKWMPYDETTASGERQLMRTENFTDYHNGFKKLLLGDSLRGVLAEVTGDEMLLFKDKINYKLPNGNGFVAHIDGPAYDHIGRIEHTTANLAVDAATVENGCLEVVPGSHKMDIELSLGSRIADRWVESHEWVQVPLNPGDLLIFGSHMAHRSSPNKSPFRRASLYATYYCRKDGEDLRQRYYADRRINFPPDHERDPEKDYSAGFKVYASAAPFTAENADTLASTVAAS
ncbi:hypothetical protein V2G26_014767 [Clonostachys chloroleuca]|uniref:Uncharacterized protein n=1 Tax=Clonostachys chloroleuca TaxID=1926264 RepID=A0AA35QG77_9HYPO|nr:unnamed protein product [Clonostachys chloroleuca]